MTSSRILLEFFLFSLCVSWAMGFNVPRRFKTGFREGILLIEHFLMCSCLGLFVGFLNYNCVVCLGTQAAPRKQAAAASA